MSEPETIHIPAGTDEDLRQTAIHVADHPPFFDPGPGVADVEAFHTHTEFSGVYLAPQSGRLANRPPDAAITRDDQIERLSAGIEMMAEKLQERDKTIKAHGETIAAQTKIIEDQERETRRACYLAAALFCGLAWREGYHVGMWIWRML